MTILRFDRSWHGKVIASCFVLVTLSPHIINPLLCSVSAFSTLSLIAKHYGHNRLFSGVNTNSELLVGSLSSTSTSTSMSTSDAGSGTSGTIFDQARATFDEFDQKGKGRLNSNELNEVLSSLEIDATPEERGYLFSYLDSNGDGFIDFEEFEEWYSSAVEAAEQTSENFRELLMSRRTVNVFDKSPVSDDVLQRAVECAIAAPNRSGSEPWRFIKIGSETVRELRDLNERVTTAGGDEATSRRRTSSSSSSNDWADVPGWCVVTSKLTPNDPETELQDFRSTSCAMQNFMLSMWSEGVGSKWTEGPTQKTHQFADIVGIDTATEQVVGIIWYGFVSGGLSFADPKQSRKKDVDDVLSMLP